MIILAFSYPSDFGAIAVLSAVGVGTFIVGFIGGLSLRTRPGSMDYDSVGADSGRELYVGNLPYEVTDAELERLFAGFGKVESARVITNRTLGTSRGYGFVMMADAASAKSAVQGLKRHEVRGRKIAVSCARTKARDRFE